MLVAVLFNPVAGRGSARAEAMRLEPLLRSAGHVPALIESSTGGLPEAGGTSPAGVQAMVVVGGDGTLRQVLDRSAGRAIPLYPYACGTENLLARELGIRPDPHALLAALEAMTPRLVDLAEANGERFVLMASIGYDAEIVHDLAAARGRSIGMGLYRRLMLRRWLTWRPPRVRIVADGRPLVREPMPGWAIAANCPQYAFGLNPARDAEMDDGWLDAVFVPLASRWELLRWMTAARAGRLHDDPRIVSCRAREIVIDCDPPQRWQIDGDPPADASRASRLVVRVLPVALAVLGSTR
jgi:diacylglycerol kinase family enzyme